MINNIDNLINKNIRDNKLIKINNNIFLTIYEIDILKLYKINYLICKNYQDILYHIEEALTYEESPELEQILLSINERHYYQNTHK